MKQKRKVFWFDGKNYDSDKPMNPNTSYNFKLRTSSQTALDDDRLAKHLNELNKPFLLSLANRRKRRNKIRRLQKKKA